MCFTMPNFVPIDQTIADIWLFLIFNMAAVRHFICKSSKF